MVVVSRSGLSLLGLGVGGNVGEWGKIVRSGSKFLERERNLGIFGGLWMMLVVVGFNFMGDGVGDGVDGKIE